MSKQLSRRTVLTGLSGLLASSAIWLGPKAAIGASETSIAPRNLNRSVTLNVVEKDGLSSYNGKPCGPVMVVDPGGRLDVHLINDLPALHDDCTEDPNRFHGLNTTNLHTHGLHVSPTVDSTGQFDADNVFLSVVPKGQMVACAEVCGEPVEKHFRWHETRFRFELPATHPSGTFWYHAHKHGATQAQVAAGLFGALIVRDRPGTMPAYIEQAPERILIITNDGVLLADPEGGGTLDPTLTLRPGAVERWRVINAQASGIGGGNFAWLSTNVPDLEMYQIAFDGLTLPKRVQIDASDNGEPWENPAALAPGNRMDLMVRVPKDARPQNFLIDLAQGLSARFQSASIIHRIGVTVDIKGDPVTALWSDDPNLPAADLAPFSDQKLPQREVTFQGGFQIDNQQFSGEVMHQVTLGSEEEWLIKNNTSAVHAFHIHVNPFLVTHINGQELAIDDPRRRWQDTVALPFNQGDDGPGTIGFRTRFERFTGKFVLHCHVLRHEDRGMMQTVEVVAPE